MKKLLISASALAIGMALSGAAMAEADSTAKAWGTDSLANSSAYHEGDDNSNRSNTSNSSKSSTSNDSLNLSVNASKTKDSNNETNRSWTSSKAVDSNNTKSTTNTSTKNTSVNLATTNTKTLGSNNDSSGSYNQSSNLSVNANAALSLQLLKNSVTGVKVSFGDGVAGDGGTGSAGGNGGVGTSNGISNLSTGTVTASGANDFSGIQTANYDTGFGSGVQGAASLAATSSIEFSATALTPNPGPAAP